MHPLFLRARIAATVFTSLALSAGSVLADEPKPGAPVSKPTVHRLVIYNGAVPEVTYFVDGGSPHLEALARLRGYTENQITLSEQLQRLKFELVASERQLTTARTTYELGQLGIGPRLGVRGLVGPVGLASGSFVGSALLGLDEARYPAVVQTIRDLEQLQTEMAKELK